MNPALSVVFFTTLAGAGQGLLLALVVADWAARHGWIGVAPSAGFAAAGAAVAAVLAALGLLASFFHLGHPERAWRAAAQWRTSWLSREVIVLPGFIALTLAYAAAQAVGRADLALPLGVLAALAALALFLCTGMIYACIRFLREWATPLTPLNFLLLGCANGLTLASALAAASGSALLPFFVVGALVFTLAGLAGRVAAWRRNASLVPKSTLQTAIGIKHPRIEQRAQGFMGGAFNTREFFHGRSAAALRALRAATGAGAFALPLLLLPLALGLRGSAGDGATLALAAATGLQYLGLLAERWLFFAEARHPQNLYYQRMA